MMRHDTAKIIKQILEQDKAGSNSRQIAEEYLALYEAARKISEAITPDRYNRPRIAMIKEGWRRVEALRQELEEPS